MIPAQGKRICKNQLGQDKELEFHFVQTLFKCNEELEKEEREVIIDDGNLIALVTHVKL